MTILNDPDNYMIIDIHMSTAAASDSVTTYKYIIYGHSPKINISYQGGNSID